MNKQNPNIPNRKILLALLCFLFIGGVYAVTTISDTEIVTTGDVTSASINISNPLTTTALIIEQLGKLVPGERAFKILTSTNVSNTALIQFLLNNRTSSGDLLSILNNGSGDGIKINQHGNGNALNIDSNATSKQSINIVVREQTSGDIFDINYKTSPVVNNVVLFEVENNDNSTGTMIRGINNGNGTGLFIEQNGLLASNRRALWVTSTVAQTEIDLILFRQDNTASIKPLLRLDNDGSGTALQIDDAPLSNQSIEIQDFNKICFDGASCAHFIMWNTTCLTNGTACIG